MTHDDEQQIRIQIKTEVAKRLQAVQQKFLHTAAEPGQFKAEIRAATLYEVAQLGRQFAHTVGEATVEKDYDLFVHTEMFGTGLRVRVIWVPLTERGREFLTGLGFSLQSGQQNVAPEPTDPERH